MSGYHCRTIFAVEWQDELHLISCFFHFFGKYLKGERVPLSHHFRSGMTRWTTFNFIFFSFFWYVPERWAGTTVTPFSQWNDKMNYIWFMFFCFFGMYLKGERVPLSHHFLTFKFSQRNDKMANQLFSLKSDMCVCVCVCVWWYVYVCVIMMWVWGDYG